tara:strand:+ start:509 stop:784 length:276 start_codon:yes stop_codon:yes gene_type:complete
MGNTYKKKQKAKPTQITKDELKTMQDYVASINQTQMQVGSFEYQKIQLIQKMGALESKLTEFNQGLTKKYGNVSVNITDGSIKEKVNEPVN